MKISGFHGGDSRSSVPSSFVMFVALNVLNITKWDINQCVQNITKKNSSKSGKQLL